MPVSVRQILSLGDGPLALQPDAETLLSLRYQSVGAPAGLSGLAFLLHFDSRQLTWGPNPARRLYDPGWNGPGPVLIPRAERPEEDDGDPGTDQVLRFSYLDPGGRWGGSGASLQLAELSLRPLPAFEHTTLRLTALSLPPGTTLEATPLELRTPARVSGLSLSGRPPQDWWTPGDVLAFSVRFSRPVQVSGQPTLALTLGGQARIAVYQEGSGSDCLRFTYTISAGDRGGLQVEANALQPPGIGDRTGGSAAIRGLDGLAADLRHQPPPLPTTRVDSSAPTVRLDPVPRISQHTSLNLSGTVIDSGGSGVAAVHIWDGSQSLGEARLNGNRWTLATGALTEGLHTISVQASDRAGNRSPISAALHITLDHTPPATPRLLKPLGGSDRVLTGADGDSVLEGLAEPGCTVTLRLGSLRQTLSTDEQGRFRWAPNTDQLQELAQSRAPLPLTLVAIDRAGNSSAPIRASLRQPETLASYGRRQVRLGSAEADSLTGSACLIDGTLRGEAIFGGSGHDTLTGVALKRTDGSGWAVPLLSGGRGDDHYLIPDGSFALIADLGGAGPGSGSDDVRLANLRADRIQLTLLEQTDLLISRRQAGSDSATPIALLLDALGRRRPEGGNRLETVHVDDATFSLRSDGALVNGQQVLLPQPGRYDDSGGLLQPTGLLGAALDRHLNLRELVNALPQGLCNQALIG